jgi:hypothetical protein
MCRPVLKRPVYNLEGERHTICSFDQTQIAKGYVLYDRLLAEGGRSFLKPARR